MRRLYNYLFVSFFCLSAPYYFLKMRRRGNWREGFGQRFGRFSSRIKQSVTNRTVLWIHAVSVGEVNVATQLIAALERRLPNLTVVMSTTTSTGMGELEKLPSHVLKIYYPIDRREYVARSLASIHPSAIVLVEAEIWPNFLWRARELRIPTFLVNARLSERSYRGYRRFGILFKSLFASFAAVGCQNEDDARKLRELGCRPEAVHVVGSLKFDAARLDERRLLDVRKLLLQLGVPESARLLVGGSTHAGEEGILAQVYQRLRRRFPDLFLILVPRHFERGREAAREVAAQGVKCVYRKEVTPATQFKPGEVDCLLVNTTGELRYFYEQAEVIFVGKSLAAEGGQNPIEPGALGKPMIFGPNMQNFEAIARTFVERQGAIQVQDVAGFEEALTTLLANEEKAAELGRNALQVVRENVGAIERTIDMLVDYLGETRVCVPARRPAAFFPTEANP